MFTSIKINKITLNYGKKKGRRTKRQEILFLLYWVRKWIMYDMHWWGRTSKDFMAKNLTKWKSTNASDYSTLKRVKGLGNDQKLFQGENFSGKKKFKFKSFHKSQDFFLRELGWWTDSLDVINENMKPINKKDHQIFYWPLFCYLFSFHR